MVLYYGCKNFGDNQMKWRNESKWRGKVKLKKLKGSRVAVWTKTGHSGKT
jgi:hypothetical protein